MENTVHDYFATVLPDRLHFAFIPELSAPGSRYYRMLSDHGSGSFRLISTSGLYLILVADFTPRETFEKISEIAQPYIEISQFETDTSSWRVGGQGVKQVDRGICCYVNNSKTVTAYCEAGRPARFTKLLITRDYFDRFIEERYGEGYSQSLNTAAYLAQNPNSPQLNFIFQQIRDCTAVGTALEIYLDGKVLEVLSLVTRHYARAQEQSHLPVKLDARDRRALAKTVSHMKRDLAAYPPVEELARLAGMSQSRYQLAFRQVYGTTVYEYLKALRMNSALLLLRDSDDDIRTVAAKVGYRNAGHFSGLFRQLYGLSPKAYRQLHGIK